MLDFPEDTKNEQKCEVTHGVMGHLDPKQPPTKRKPFSAILAHPFVHKVQLVLPAEIYEIIKNEVFREEERPDYSRVILPLKALLEGEFFNQYIKIGNILMLSEGNPATENVYTLREGILTLHLDKESYERAGIVGKPEGVKGKRGTKPRWIVEINLRLPSMLHGKKGFDRIAYAFKNVLTTPITWLFKDLQTSGTSSISFLCKPNTDVGKAITPRPLEAHFPIEKISSPSISEIQVLVPQLNPPKDVDVTYGADFEDYSVEVHEWLALICLESPAIDPEDTTDSFLCRYNPPQGADQIAANSSPVVKLTWQGFISPNWAHELFVKILLAVSRVTWFAYCVDGFGEGLTRNCRNCTILRLPNAPNEYVLWEVS
ncbi:hypothetical protein HYALB_00012924 [Hymenoscyphus albidus]|uniref:Uncharacterized protein n=1 Tax=Hymenoscyphus albidus TaxID=595503 RepID=A0A9N9LXT1_9HELO|nr:hypothetical protein HYALB_00012924 [Hymenoscyphus albidus]